MTTLTTRTSKPIVGSALLGRIGILILLVALVRICLEAFNLRDLSDMSVRSAASSPLSASSVALSNRVGWKVPVVPLSQSSPASSEIPVTVGEHVKEGVVRVSANEHSRPFTTSTTISTTSQATIPPLWGNSTTLPDWMKEYFHWHRAVRDNLNETNWENYRYLLLRCVAADKKCAGASDRLKAVPVAIRLAERAQPQRILFIAWRRPARLEEFLLPPPGGFDWRLPDWLATKLDVEKRGPKFWLEDNAQKWPTYKDPIARIKNIRGSNYYDDLRAPTEATFDDVYHAVWAVTFQPSPAVATLVRQQLEQLHLQPRQYVGAHVRAMYVSDTREHGEELNALRCASQVGPGLPIFFASDSLQTTQNAMEYGQANHVVVVTRKGAHEPLHLDRGRDFFNKSEDWQGRPPSDFYDTFVDLFLLAHSKCLSFGVGGYGSWASLVAGTHRCAISHRSNNCTWMAQPSEQ